jgi:hypothetical protein
MYLVHKALRAEAARVEKMAEQLEIGASLQPFRLAFNLWAAALGYHAEAENKYMTGPLTNCQPARDCEAEHADLANRLGDLAECMDKDDTRELAEKVRDVMARLNEEQHRELTERLEDVMAVLNEEIGKTRLIERTKRHLYGRVVALRIAQDDHLDNEEAFVLPVVRERMSEAQQAEVARHLLVDEAAQDPLWIEDWVVRDLTSGEKRLLVDYEEHFEELAAGGSLEPGGGSSAWQLWVG